MTLDRTDRIVRFPDTLDTTESGRVIAAESPVNLTKIIDLPERMIGTGIQVDRYAVRLAPIVQLGVESTTVRLRIEQIQLVNEFWV